MKNHANIGGRPRQRPAKVRRPVASRNFSAHRLWPRFAGLPHVFGVTIAPTLAATIPATKAITARELSLPYAAGLDGLRALAVFAVILYHANVRWIPGGFIGVEVFFVISGYLITSLLLSEWRQHQEIDLKRFWLRRARRLLPALFLTIVVTLAFAVVFLPDEVAWLRKDALAAFGYVTNWYLVLDHQSYFQSVGRPSLLRHLWSLAVEEQFYLIWPLLFTVGMRIWRLRLLFLAVLAGGIASALLMATLYQPDVDPSRVYYGTDTRAAALLLGAALAFLWVPGHMPGESRPGLGLPLDALGLAALGLLVYLSLRITEYQPFLYQGGFILVSLATAMVIAVVVHPRGFLGPGLLGRQPLVWIGLRSYSLYLWHWPVFMLTRPQLDVPLDGLPLLFLRMAITVVFAEVSYRFVELPVRSGALGRAWRTLWQRGETTGDRFNFRVAGLAGAGIVLLTGFGLPVACARPPAPAPYLLIDETPTVSGLPTRPPAGSTPSPAPWVTLGASGRITSVTQGPATATKPLVPATITPTSALEPPDEPTVTASPVPAPPTQPPVPAATRAGESPTAAPPATATVAIQPLPAATETPTSAGVYSGLVTIMGDSVMLGATRALVDTLGDGDVDAAVSRQASAVIDLLRQRRDAGQLGSVVVIQVGNNGTFSARQFDEIMRLLADSRRVVFVTVKVPRPWESPNNGVIAEGVKRYPNTVLADWRSASANHPEYFWDDGIHLRPEGARAYAELIASAIERQ